MRSVTVFTMTDVRVHDDRSGCSRSPEYAVEEYPSLLESPHRPLRSAHELVGEAGRFREPIPDGAGKDDLLRAAQVDQVTDTDEDRIGGSLESNPGSAGYSIGKRRTRTRASSNTTTAPSSNACFTPGTLARSSFTCTAGRR